MPKVYVQHSYFVGLRTPDAHNFEGNRLITFTKWPHNHPLFVSELAKNGFKATGSGDEVKCVFCKFLHKDWKFGEKPSEIHERYSPCCPIFNNDQAAPSNPVNIPLPVITARVNGFSDAFNILMRNLVGTNYGGVQESGTVAADIIVVPPFPGVNMRAFHLPVPPPATRPLTAIDGSPIFTASEPQVQPLYPSFKSSMKRQQSFHLFPCLRGLSPTCLEEAGFFYTGHEDIVICHFCGLCLYQWLHGEDPAIAHARWKPSCHYMINWKGLPFIHRVQRELQIYGQAS